jgi:hypothetical protein
MTNDEEHSYGPKLNRLLRMSKMDLLSGLVPPTFPIPALPSFLRSDSAEVGNAANAYARALTRALPQLTRDVEQRCGPAPWIVRSSGIEDLAEHVNAGGYDSLLCLAPENLVPCIASVALSGATEHARRQQALSGQVVPPKPIACFVQPLLNIDVATDVGAAHSPYLDAVVLDRMEAICAELIAAFDFEAIDCEWGIETTDGFVSVTTIAPRDRGWANVAHTIGFGFGSAQNTGSRATSLALLPASSDIRLWRGRHLRETKVQRLHLLQARPAYPDAAFRERAALTDECYEALSRHYDVVDAGLLILGAQSAGHALIAPHLMSAWRRYLALEADARGAIAVVIVDEGSAEEHAGIMFRQQNVTCVKADTQRVPPGADCVAFDRGVCIIGDATMLGAIRAEVRRELVIPDDCALVFTDEVLTAAGQLVPECIDALSQLHRLPLAAQVKERLLARTEQPMATRWMQRAGGAIESPSLLGQIGRSHCSKYAGTFRARTDFARSYERAVQVLRSEPCHGLPLLSALSSHIDVLVRSGDLRLVMALLDIEAATSWARPETLAALLHSAAEQLAAQRRDDAVLVLNSVSLVSAECARLPVYETDEIVSYLDALASAFERGLAAESMICIHFLGLPIGSVVRLAQRVPNHPAMLEPMEAFRRAVASFRGITCAAEVVAPLAQQLSDAHSCLQNALREAGLRDVAEQINGSLIEIYDASLKALLARAAEANDVGTYRRYLLVMREWIALLSTASLLECDRAVLHCFDVWLHRWSAEAMPPSFEIEDRNWRSEFASIAAAPDRAPRYENSHVVHNLLHQWSLARLSLDTRMFPHRIQSLERFCSTFSSRATKVLRFERELLEIQIPMGTHKASYVFTPRQITVEWTEPPDCPSDQIARLIAFEVFLDRFRTWMFPALTMRRERALGTWTLFVRLVAPAANPWRYDDANRFVTATRFLFDGSYDFSYVRNDAVDGFAERFAEPEWKSIVAALIEYRALIEDTAQYVALHTSPMSSAVSAIAQSRVVRGLIMRCRRRGLDECRQLIDNYAYWLGISGGADHRWQDRYEYLRQLTLFFAAKWPREALTQLVRRSRFHIGDDLIAACLFKRRDIKDELRGLATERRAILSGIFALIVRHAPDIAIASCGASALASQLVDTGVRYRRAKHFVAAHFGDHIDPPVLGRLLEGMGTVPWGYTEAAEQAIQAQISAHRSVCRFDLERGIDWTTLDRPASHHAELREQT